MKIFSSSQAVAVTMRLTLIPLLSSTARSQDENIGNLLWDASGTILDIDAAILNGGVAAGAAAGAAVGSAAFDLGVKGANSLIDTTNNLFADPTTNDPTSDSTVDPATEGGITVDQTNDLFTTKPALAPPDDPAKTNEPADTFHLSVTADQSPKKTSLDDECDTTKSTAPNSDGSCDKATPQIIWPTECGDSTIIQDTLTQAGVKSSDIRTSEDDCGTYLLTAPMTKEQIGKALGMATASIKTIVTDDPVISDGLSGTSMPSRRKKNRRQNLIRVNPAPDHLHFISTAVALDTKRRVMQDYWYLENAGQSINGYMLLLADLRMKSNNPEFMTENIIRSYSRALAPVEETDEYDYEPPGSALSLVSLVGGAKFGVIKKASLSLITVNPRTSSFLDGLKILFRLLRDQLNNNVEVRSRTVVMTPIGFNSLPGLGVSDDMRPDANDPMLADRINELEAQRLVQELIDQFEVVFVCAAGEIKAGAGSTLGKEPYQWPANWASKPSTPPIITVGGVDQATGLVAEPNPRFSQLPSYSDLPGSLSGDSVTVYAPYFAYADFGESSPRRTGGTACSAAMAMGVIMGYLSQQTIRGTERLDLNEKRIATIPTAVKIRTLLVKLAYPRVAGGPKVIWNGLGGNRESQLSLNSP